MLTLHFSVPPVLKTNGREVGFVRAMELIEPVNVPEGCLLIAKLHVFVSDEEGLEELDRWERGRIVRLEK
jgi:hypothetical protein